MNRPNPYDDDFPFRVPRMPDFSQFRPPPGWRKMIWLGATLLVGLILLWGTARISGERERDLQRIQSEAYRTAQELRGKADAEATTIYAEAHNRDASFYAFTKSLETYEKTIDPKTMLILTTRAELLRYFERTR
jgi:regulator of protease activity HflC (stomatin/prohibitin superfamily)